MKTQGIPEANIDEQNLNNPVNENNDETKIWTSGREVLKLRKTSFRIDIESLNKVSDERDHIDKGDQVDKKEFKYWRRFDWQ